LGDIPYSPFNGNYTTKAHTTENSTAVHARHDDTTYRIQKLDKIKQ